MPLINEDQIDAEFQIIKLGVPPFATVGTVRLGDISTIHIRNGAEDDNLLVFSRSGPDVDYDDRLVFGSLFMALKLAGVGHSALIEAEAHDIGGYIKLVAGNGAGQGGDILLNAGNATDVGAEGGGEVALNGGNGVDAGGPISLAAGTASADSTAGGGVDIASGIGKGVPVSSIEFFTAGSEAVASDVQAVNLRGTMADEVFTWDGVLKLTPRAFADLPAAPTEGMMAWVNDSSTATWGATVAGGGANKVLAVFNGTVWTCAAI